MNQTSQSEKYEIAYKDDGCCIYACPALECPETICYLDYPGYKKTMEKFKQVLLMHKSGVEIEEICHQVGLRKKQVQNFLNLLNNLVIV
jgi:hypothetical protein